MTVRSDAVKVFNCEIESIALMRDHLDDNFDIFVDKIVRCKGRIIFTGMGKSGSICKKIVSTMQSLGIKAYFLHPAEALHGGLGVIDKNDLVIAASNSGETAEVLGLLPIVRRIGSCLLSIVGKADTTLQGFSEVTILMPPIKEAYLNALVPTSSTTALLVLGDAMAVAAAKKMHFTAEDFGVYHPGGMLGKMLTLTIGEIKLTGEENSIVYRGSTVKMALMEMCLKSISGVNIIDEEGKFLGILTDGDMRRIFNKSEGNMMELIVDDIMTRNPLFVSSNMLVMDAIKKINDRGQGYAFFPVIDEGYLTGSVRMIDITKSGLLG